MEAISWLGDQPQMFLLISFFIFVLLFLKLRREAFILALNSVGIYVLGNLIKLFVQRPRPPFSLLHDWSFPSGHVLSFRGIMVLGKIGLRDLVPGLMEEEMRVPVLVMALVPVLVLVQVMVLVLCFHNGNYNYLHSNYKCLHKIDIQILGIPGSFLMVQKLRKESGC